VASGDVDGPDLRTGSRPAATRLQRTCEHDDTAVRCPGRPLILPAMRQQALARAVRPHHPDPEIARRDLGEGDQIAARTPNRSAVLALAKADAMHIRAVGIHHVDLLRAAAAGFEGDLLSVRRK